jgi:hypothetical protein
MFPNFLQLFSRRPDEDYEHAFVREVNITRKPVRDPRIERLIWTCWVLIALKSLLVWWACSTYDVPVDPLWVIVPTVVFAVLCTCVYYWRR